MIDFTHSGDGFCSITGGFVVRDAGLPTLNGRYLYGDVCKSQLRSVALAPGSASGDRAEPTLPAQTPTSFGEDVCGRVYVATIPGYAHAAGQRVPDRGRGRDAVHAGARHARHARAGPARARLPTRPARACA